MSLSQKNYKRIAEIICNNTPYLHANTIVRNKFLQELEGYFMEDNPSFLPLTFYEACQRKK